MTHTHLGAETFSLGRINREMERQAERGWTDEAALESLRARIKARPGPKGRAHRLTLARLAELALWWAGALADAGELQAVGDLLCNPRRKLLYVRNRPSPLRLARHGAITRQVAHLVPPGRDTIDWLKRETTLLALTKPLLPGLLQDLSRWPGPGGCGPAGFRRRLERIADCLCLMGGLRPPPGVGPARHLASLPREEAASLAGRLCGFDLERFHALGRELAPLLAPPGLPAPAGPVGDHRRASL